MTARARVMRAGVVGVVLLGCATGVEGQRRRPGVALPPANVTIGVSGGWTRDAAEAFADPICPETDASSWNARAGFRVFGPVVIQAAVGYHKGQEDGDCVNGLVPPVPPVGPHTRETSFYDEKVRGYPFFSTTARAGIELPVGQAMRVRGLGGMGVVWEKNLPFRLLGAEVLFGRGGWTIFADGERWWHDVPRRTVVASYLDGGLVGQEQTTVDVHHRTTLLRLGLEFAVSR